MLAEGVRRPRLRPSIPPFPRPRSPASTTSSASTPSGPSRPRPRRAGSGASPRPRAAWDSQASFEEAALREDPQTRDRAGALMARYAAGFPAGYRDLYDASETVPDIVEMEDVGPDRPVAIRAYRYADEPASTFRFELYRWKEAAALADVLPILDNMGLKALVEEGFKPSPGAAHAIRPTPFGRTSSPWPTPAARRSTSTGSRRRSKRRSSPSGTGGPRTTVSTGWWSSLASPGARRPCCGPWRAIASSPGSSPARSCSRRR